MPNQKDYDYLEDSVTVYDLYSAANEIEKDKLNGVKISRDAQALLFAANTIQALTAENERLRALLSRAQYYVDCKENCNYPCTKCSLAESIAAVLKESEP